MNEKYCVGCGKPLHVTATTCPHCGAPQGGTSLSGRNRIVAAILALLLGSIGAHKFYLGQTGLGILYLLFCWTFIPALIALVEGIIYLSMSDDDFARKYS